jgi:hypothetical protein
MQEIAFRSKNRKVFRGTIPLAERLDPPPQFGAGYVPDEIEQNQIHKAAKTTLT